MEGRTSRYMGELDRTKNGAMFATFSGTSWSELIDSVKEVKEEDLRGLVKMSLLDAVGGDEVLKNSGAQFSNLNSRLIGTVFNKGRAVDSNYTGFGF
ncbi:hypothetical protein ACOME3_010358 [Neoechinorhynchus agilis]